MPAPARKTSSTEPKVNTPADEPDDVDTNEEEFNPVVIPDGWEAIPESEGGGMRPTTVPWKGYESA